MDASTIATVAVTAVHAFLARVGSQLGERTGDDVGRSLYEAVKRRLAFDADSIERLRRLEAQPQDATNQTALRAVMAATIQADPGFRSEVLRLFEEGEAAQSASISAAMSTHNELHVGRMSRSNVAFGPMNVDASRHNQVRRQNLLAVVAIAAVLAVMAGVVGVTRQRWPIPWEREEQGGAESAGASGGVGTSERGSANGRAGSWTGRGRGIVAFGCGSSVSGGSSTVTLALISPDSGAVVESTSVQLPDRAELAFGCGRTATRYAYRQMFNRDFTQVAVERSDPTTGANHVGVVDIPSGKFTDLTGAASPSFGGTPRDMRPVFDLRTGEIWYYSAYHRKVLSRDSKTGAVRERLAGQFGAGFVLAPEGGWVIDRTDAVPNPSGRAAIEGQTLYLRGSDEISDLFCVNEYDSGCIPLSGDFDYGLNEPQAWLDDHRLVVTTDTSHHGPGVESLGLVTFSADFTSANGRKLLPDNNRVSNDAVPSADGSEFVFLSKSGPFADDQAIYRQSFTAGSQPRRIETIAGMVLLEWR